MKKYHIENCGCDDACEFDIELTDEELKTIIKLFDENNKIASYDCTPHLYIYEYDENKSNWQYNIALNKDYEELNGIEV